MSHDLVNLRFGTCPYCRAACPALPGQPSDHTCEGVKMHRALVDYLREYDTPAPDLMLRETYRDRLRALVGMRSGREIRASAKGKR